MDNTMNHTMDQSGSMSMVDMEPSSHSPTKEEIQPLESTYTVEIHGHMLIDSDPDNPKNWPLQKKVYASSVSFAFAFAVAFGLTSYTAGISEVPKRFNVSMEEAVAGFSLYLFGIAFAPVYTPHLSEKYGRTLVYLATLPIWMLFVLGTGYSETFGGVAVCRFFAGAIGGPSLVLIEGTFADVWSARRTGTYYAFLTLASYLGAACGPLIGGFVFAATSWRWTQWITLMIGLAVYLFGIGMPETYAREIIRARAKKHGLKHHLPLALSGVTFSQMAQITFFTPLKMLITEPLVILISLYLAFNFAVLFQWFITVPVALSGVFNFTIQQDGLAFISAIVGVFLAAATTTALDTFTAPKPGNQNMEMTTIYIEYRLFPAMIGCLFMPAALFWVGWTASPSFTWATPVVGTLFYVWGSALTLISFIGYLFDAYPAAGTLSALTAAASLRLIFAGWLPLVILQMFMGITPAWALSTFGFIAAAMIPVPFAMYMMGPRLRRASKYADHGMMAEGQEQMVSNGMDMPAASV